MSDETAETVARLLNRGVIDLAQLHGSEGGDYVDRLRKLTAKAHYPGIPDRHGSGCPPRRGQCC